MTTNISQFRGDVQPDVIGCPVMVVDRAINDAIIQLCKDAHLFKKAFEHSVDASEDVDTTDNDAIEIDLSSYVSVTLRPYTVLELKIDGVPWNATFMEIENDVEDISMYQPGNTKLFNFPDTGTIKLYPMDTTDDVTVWLKMAWLPLRTMTTIDDFIFNDYNQAVAAYAKWLLMRQPGKAWSNLELADYHLSEYSRKAEEAKIEILQGKNFGDMRVKSMRLF